MNDIYKGVKLRGKNELWRVLNVENNRVTVIDLKCSGIKVKQFLYSDLNIKLKKKMLYVEEDPIYELDHDKLNEGTVSKYKARKRMVDMVEQAFGPNYLELKSRKCSDVLAMIMKSNNMIPRTFWRILGNYLKSGLKDYSLYDKRFFTEHHTNRSGAGRNNDDGSRPYKLNERDYSLMKKWAKKFLTITSTEYTLEYCYTKLQDEYRDNNGDLIQNSYPSIRQFSYYIYTHSKPEQLAAKKTSLMEVRNNRRLLNGDTVLNVYGPMDVVEIDAHEVDVSLISADGKGVTVVGRPVIYYMIDRYTRVIVGYTTSFDNNATIAMNRTFECLIDPKSKLFERHPDAPKYAIPYGILPAQVINDNGSDFVSNEARRCARANGLEFHFSPAGVASLKPIVERSFGNFEKTIDPMFRNAGLIKKRHDSNHHKKAVLTIDQFRYIVEEFVYFHNTTLCEGIAMTKDMIDYNVRPVPCDVWRHCVENKGQIPKPIKNFDEYRINLYTHKKGTITRYGILINKMKYIDKKNTLLEEKCFKNEKEKIEVALNPATVNYIFYKFDGAWSRAWLNPDLLSQNTYMNMSWAELDKYRKEENRRKKEEVQEKRNKKSEFYKNSEKVINAAKKEHTNKDNDVSQIRKAREKEKLQEQKKLGLKNVKADDLYDNNQPQTRIESSVPSLQNESNEENVVDGTDYDYTDFMENL